MTSFRVIESSGSVGSIQVADGLGDFISGSLIAGANISIDNDGSGNFTIAASGGASSTIGNAEDGDYSDGLFTDFTSSTAVSTAVDRFNEVLKALAPAPAPDLDNINSQATGIFPVSLSFGASNDQSVGSPAYATVEGTAGVAAAVDVNGVYTSLTSDNNIRLGIFSGDTHISGTLNSDVIANSQGNSVQNYPAFSFGGGDVGTLRLEVNGSTAKEINLTSVLIGSGTSGIGTGSHVDANGTGFNFVSTPTSGTFSNGNAFLSFKHRTAKYVVAAESQRRGWNYARVLHIKGSSTSETNYIEWVNDDNADALSASSVSLSFAGSGNTNLSGVKYFTGGDLTYQAIVANAYKYVYDTTAITLTPAYSGDRKPTTPTYSPGPVSKPAIGVGEDHTKTININETDSITSQYILGGSVTVTPEVTHPRKANLTTGAQATAPDILVYNVSDASTLQSETFQSEAYRLQDNTYANQTDVTGGSLDWDSTQSLVGVDAGHNTGLQIYKEALYSPLNTLNSGDFSSLTNGPTSNVNYSGVTGLRTFYRKFQNNSTDARDLSYTIEGSGRLVDFNDALSGNRFRLFFKMPDDGSGNSTGWLDAKSSFSFNNVADDDGCAIGTVDNTANMTNNISFGTVTVGNGEYIVAKIIADASWSGALSSFSVSFGAVGTVDSSPSVSDIDLDTSPSYSGKLSFGVSKAIAGYTNVSAAAGNSAVDLNGEYLVGGTRYGIFGGAIVDKTGTVNEQIQSSNATHSNNYPDNAFGSGKANEGILKLEVNGTVLHTVDLAVFTSGDTNSTGSCFTSLSAATAGEDSNGLPDFTKFYRTSDWKVIAADQNTGFNYARVIHSVGVDNHEASYVEWVNDTNTDALSFAGTETGMFGDDTFSFVSGVKYFNSPSGSIQTRISNLYKNVYSNSASAISFGSPTNANCSAITQSGDGLTSTKTTNSSAASLQNLLSTAGSQNEVCHVTGTINFSHATMRSLPGHPDSSVAVARSCGGTLTFDHTHKSNDSITTSTTNLLVWTPSNENSNDNDREDFTVETNRLPAANYTTQNSVGTASWVSSNPMNSPGSYAEYSDGLLVYYKALISPLVGGVAGDFRNHKESGGIESPSSNVDYSGISAGDRTYYRRFLSNVSADRPSIAITLKGDATLVAKSGSRSGTPGANKNIQVEVKVPGKTGWLDLAKDADGTITDGGGCLSGGFTGSITGSGAANACTFSGQTANGTGSGAEYIVIRVTAHTAWTGSLSEILIGWSG